MSDLVSFSSLCEIGQKRQINQDSIMVCNPTTGEFLPNNVESFTLSENSLLMAVSDGIGQKKGGEVASKLAISSIQQLLSLSNSTDIAQQMQQAFLAANNNIRQQQQQDADRSEMAATLTAIFINKNDAFIGQVGDSRAYILRNKIIKQLTTDHSLYQHLLQTGAINQDTVITQEKHVLLQAIGTENIIQPEITTLQLQDLDLLLLCTDGLTDKLNDTEIAGIISRSKSLNQACSLLVRLAKLRGAEDDISIILARFSFGNTVSFSQPSMEVAVTKILEYDAKKTRNYMRNINRWMMNTWTTVNK